MAGASVQCVVWEWQRDDGGFSPYPPDMSSQIEAAYSTGTGSYIMVDYTVHISRMIQKKHNTGIVSLPPPWNMIEKMVSIEPLIRTLHDFH